MPGGDGQDEDQAEAVPSPKQNCGQGRDANEQRAEAPAQTEWVKRSQAQRQRIQEEPGSGPKEPRCPSIPGRSSSTPKS